MDGKTAAIVAAVCCVGSMAYLLYSPKRTVIVTSRDQRTVTEHHYYDHFGVVAQEVTYYFLTDNRGYRLRVTELAYQAAVVDQPLTLMKRGRFWTLTVQRYPGDS